jgi:hypothetical protein
LHAHTAALFEHYPDQAADAYIRVLLAAGREEEARAVWSPDRPIRRDYFYELLLTLRGVVAVQLRDLRGAQLSYERLLPFTGRLGGAACGSITLWPVDTVLGDLAALLGRPHDARRHYTDSVALCRRAGSDYLEAQAAAGLASLPDDADAQQHVAEPAGSLS